MGASGRRSAGALLCLAVLAGGCTTGGPPPLVTSDVAETSTPVADVNELVIGVDDLGAGFNPHTLADLGPVSLGVADLVLPSPFRYGADGVLRMDPTLIESAAVTAQQPFTVSYQLRREASWSDGAPIAAEDFAYLAERMRGEPGVASPAGYRLISQVVSRSGGKQVEVVFDRPYPGWRTLFRSLLPAHLLKDAPGGWAQALETGIPVSGGPFAMRAVDAGLGMVVLERNDRYWGVPAVLDRLVLRQAEPADLVAALATGGDQLALWRADSIGMGLLREHAAQLPVRSLPEPLAVELLLRPAGQALSDARLRAVVAAAIDLPELVELGTGNGPGAQLPARARTLLPSQPGYAPTVPDGLPTMRADPGEVAALLAAAGYRAAPPAGGASGGPPAGGGSQGAARLPRLVVAAPQERATYVTLAKRVVRQLQAVGIDAELVTPTGDELFATMTAPPPPEGNPADTTTTATTTSSAPGAEDAERVVDIAVVPRPVTGDPAADLASWYGCPGAEQDPAQAANPAGYCNRSLQADLDDLLAGASTLGETLPAIEAALWLDLPSIPLLQHSAVLVTGRHLDNVEPGGLLAGPFADAPLWRRTPR